MPYYRYLKGPVTYVDSRYRSGNRLKRIVAPILITLGSVLIANVMWPIAYYQIATAPTIRKTEFVSPVALEMLGSKVSLAAIPTHSPETTQVLGSEIDYTKASTWFPSVKYGVPGTGENVYYLSIPILGMEAAKVIVNGENLDESLIHYSGTALPGQLGSSVIFGHSVLRQFYNPSPQNPKRYLSIFSKIMTLKSGDQLFIDYDGIRYTYEVKEKFEVKPEDVFILEQRYTTKELKLITCVPEGTYLRRGVVLAQLVDLE